MFLQRGKLRKKKIFVTCLLMVGVYGIINYFVARTYASPPRKFSSSPPQGFENLKIDTSGGDMPVWVSNNLLKKTPESCLVYILVHGYRSCRSFWSEVATNIAQKGHEVLVATLRGHDNHPYPHTCYGIDESKDLSSVIDWVFNQYKKMEVKIVLVGTSLGGATCWLTSFIDYRVSGIVSDGTFIDAVVSGDRWIANVLLGGEYIFKPMPKMTELLIGRRMSDAAPVENAKNWKGKPALIIHSEKDHLVTLSESTYLSEISGGELWHLPGVGHVQGSEVYLNKYVHKLLEFGDKILNN